LLSRAKKTVACRWSSVDSHEGTKTQRELKIESVFVPLRFLAKAKTGGLRRDKGEQVFG
jgi:hypothetical protein